MSEISANIVVEPFDITIQVDNPGITVTPETINLNLYAAGGTNGAPEGNTGDIQYNNGSGFGAIPSNIANYTSSNVNFNLSNLKISGGTNGYVLQTDGSGNLTWTAQSGGGGNGSPGGSNTQIQFNDNGIFGGNVGFTFNKTTGNTNLPAHLIVANTVVSNDANLGNSVVANYFTGRFLGLANTAQTVTFAAQPNITSVGTLTSLDVTANIGAGNLNANSGNVNANIINSNGFNTGNITITGTATIQQAKEKVTTNATGATGTLNYDLLNQAIYYFTSNATANFTVNFRGNSSTTLDTVLNSNQSMTCTLINPNGVTGYYANVIQIDGNTITPVWSTIPTGTPSATDMYTFNIIKTAGNTFKVFGTIVGYV